jgi:hypothetical protein
MWEKLGIRIGDEVLRLGEAFLAIIPAMIVLLGALVVGATVGLVLRGVLALAFRVLRVGDGTVPVLRAAGLRAPPAVVASAVSFWAAVVVALSVGVGALEPGGLKSALQDVVSFLPRLLTAALFTFLGVGLAALARRSVLLAAVNSGLPWARGGARLVHIAVLVFFVSLALDHLGVGGSILAAAFSIVLGGFVLAVALAFGLGARDLARAYLERRLRAEQEENGIRHV